MTPGTHGSTYGGNPLACAVGNAVMEIVADEDFLADVNRRAGMLRQGLESLVARNLDVFEEVRGAGLMLGLKCRVPNGDFVHAAFGQELVTIPGGDNVVRLLPALNIPEADIREALDRLERTAAALVPA